MDMNTRAVLTEATTKFLAAPKKMLIGAEWVDAADGSRLDVHNPANGEVFTRVPAGGVGDIEAGTVWVNCHSMLDASLPFGGYKQSGFGREMGRAALDLFTETKSVLMAV